MPVHQRTGMPFEECVGGMARACSPAHDKSFYLKSIHRIGKWTMGNVIEKEEKKRDGGREGLMVEDRSTKYSEGVNVEKRELDSLLKK